MDYAGLNEKLMEAVKALHKAKLPHLAGELHALVPIRSLKDAATLSDRFLTVLTLMRLKKPSDEQAAKIIVALTDLEKELQFFFESR
jgi:hypothetical protein